MAGSGTAHLRAEGEALLRAEHVVMEFPVGSTGLKVHAVSDVSLDLLEGETLGLVGESGCGKSTYGRAIMQINRPTSGAVLFEGADLTKVRGDALREVRSKLQMIFQDPISSLNPRRSVGEIVREPLTIQWLESFPRSPAAHLWESYVRRLSAWWTQLWRWARWVLPPLALGLLMWVVGARAANSAGPGEELGGVASALSKLTSLSKILLIPSAVALVPVLAFVAVTAAVWLVLVVAMALSGIPRKLAIRRARARFLEESDVKVRSVLNIVGLDPEISMPKYPHQFSGGQCQRISVARSLVLEPKVLICDEPVSALDVSIQAQVLNLLEDLKARYGLTMVFISHDLSVVKNISDRVAVMYLGKLCEVAGAEDLYASPAHPYTAALLASIPVPDPSANRSDVEVAGEIPSPIAPPSGCRFRTRCPLAQDRCANEEPQLAEVRPGHFTACHFPLVSAPVAVD